MLISKALAGLSLTLLLLTLDSSRRLELFVLPMHLFGGLLYSARFCLAMASPILLIWIIAPLYLGKRRPVVLVLFLLGFFLTLLFDAINFGRILVLYETAPMIAPVFLSLALLNIAEIVTRRLDAFYATCWVPPLVSFAYWFLSLSPF